MTNDETKLPLTTLKLLIAANSIVESIDKHEKSELLIRCKKTIISLMNEVKSLKKRELALIHNNGKEDDR